MSGPRIVVLAGGVGAARFLQGVLSLVAHTDVTVIGNVGDDVVFGGLHVSPDLDTVLYTLTDAIDEERGWGVRDDTSRALERSRALGFDPWFWLGDLDIGLHLARTAWLAEGSTLSDVTSRFAQAMGLRARLIPCTDDRLRTVIQTMDGEIDFQEYFVKRGHRDEVHGVRFDGAAGTSPAPGVLEALQGAAAILLAPSNPLISIAPILAVPGIREALEQRVVRCVAVSPIVAGAALRGPAADMLRSLGHDVSPLGVVDLYAGLIDAVVIDDADAQLAAAIEARGVSVVVADTIMRSAEARRNLAHAALQAAGIAERT
jgi:LPPG:FO 2-phospho-L-lactate transferase